MVLAVETHPVFVATDCWSGGGPVPLHGGPSLSEASAEAARAVVYRPVEILTVDPAVDVLGMGPDRRANHERGQSGGG